MIPPIQWFKQSLLLNESTSSIVHPELLEALERGQSTRGEWMAADNPSSKDLQYLADEGLWQPKPVGWLQDDISYMADVRTSLQQFVTAQGGASQGRRTRTERLFLGKLAHGVEQALEAAGLVVESNGVELRVHPHVAHNLLSITARHLASQENRPDSRVVTSTDDALGLEEAYGSLDAAPHVHHCYEFVLDGVLPAFAPTVPFETIIRFRDQYRSELLLLRRRLAELAATAATSEDPVDAIRKAREELELARTGVRAAAHGKDIALVGLSASIIAVSSVVAPNFTAWAFSGAAVAGLQVVNRSVRAGNARADEYAYLVRAQRHLPAE